MQILSGNKQVAQAAAAGQIAFGLTDTDDAMGEVEKGEPGGDRLSRQRERTSWARCSSPTRWRSSRAAPIPRRPGGWSTICCRREVEAQAGRGPQRPDSLEPQVTDASRASRRPRRSRPCRSTFQRGPPLERRRHIHPRRVCWAVVCRDPIHRDRGYQREYSTRAEVPGPDESVQFQSPTRGPLLPSLERAIISLSSV